MKIIPYDSPRFDPLQFVNEYIPELSDSETSTGFCDLSEISRRLKLWQESCSGVCPLFILRRNYDSRIMKLAAGSFKCRFACSSRGELEELLRSDVPVENIFWTNSSLSLTDCKVAHVAKVAVLQVGRRSALEHITVGHPEAKIILNVSIDPEDDSARTSRRIGFTLTEFQESLLVAKQLDLNVTGVALSRNPKRDHLTVEEIFHKARELINMVEVFGFNVETLIVPEVLQDLSLDNLALNLQKMKESSDLLRQDKSLQIFCETYDAVTTSSLTIFMTIQAVRRLPIPGTDQEKVQYFVDDGRHNSFRKVPRTVRHSSVNYLRRSAGSILGNSQVYPSEVFGPSCDGDDIIVSNVLMPELANGDLIYLTNVGSDTTSTRNDFYGFQNCKVFHFIHRRTVVDM